MSDGTAETAAVVEPAASPRAGDTAEAAGEPAEQGAAVEGVEIPKQQSAEDAADSEAGEGARQ
ncbi:gliding motility protein [Streptomyces sp. NPDC006283]|uniref:gliding motility protein n=1 Tax=Streptomyces sp. NPDC006283 TaxID=3156741 RepID=UPI0033B28403